MIWSTSRHSGCPAPHSVLDDIPQFPVFEPGVQVGYKSSHTGLSVACISCARLLAAQTYTTVRRKQLLKLFRKIVAETMRLSRYLGMWGTRGVGSQVSYIPKQFLLLFASMLRGSFL